MEYLRAFLEEYHGKKQEDWFRLFDIESKGIIRFYELKWAMRTFMHQYIKEEEVKILYGALRKVCVLQTKDQSGGIHAEQFECLFNQ